MPGCHRLTPRSTSPKKQPVVLERRCCCSCSKTAGVSNEMWSRSGMSDRPAGSSGGRGKETKHAWAAPTRALHKRKGVGASNCVPLSLSQKHPRERSLRRRGTSHAQAPGREGTPTSVHELACSGASGSLRTSSVLHGTVIKVHRAERSNKAASQRLQKR